MSTLPSLALVLCVATAPGCRVPARFVPPPDAPDRVVTAPVPAATSTMNIHKLEEQLAVEAPAVLQYLVERLDAPGGLLDGIRVATVIAMARVTKVRVAGVKVADTAKSDPTVRPYLDDVGSIYAEVLELEIIESLLGPSDALTLAWPQPPTASTGGPPLPPVGAEIVVIATQGGSVIAREIARGVPGALAADRERRPIFMPVELHAELRWRRDVRARPAREQVTEALAHLGAAGRRAAPAVDIVMRQPIAELDPLARWVGTAEGTGGLLGRALLWRAGDRTAAAAGLDIARIPAAWLEGVGISVADAEGARLTLLAPSRHLPLL